jgi:hypothetical protein
MATVYTKRLFVSTGAAVGVPITAVPPTGYTWVITDMEAYIGLSTFVSNFYVYHPDVTATFWWVETADFINHHYQWSGRVAAPAGLTFESFGQPMDLTVTGYELLLP